MPPEGEPVSVFPSGGYPGHCPQGHPLKGPERDVIISYRLCECANARTQTPWGHMTARCERCAAVFYDPPCSHTQKPRPQQ